MLVIYDINTKKVVSCSTSTVKEVSWDDLKQFYTPNDQYGHFNCEDNLFNDVLENIVLYSVDDSTSPVLIKGKYKKIIFDCQHELLHEGDKNNSRRYQTALENTSIDFSIKFLNEDNDYYYPVGTIVIKCNKGTLEWNTKELDGSVCELALRWEITTSDNADLKIKAKLNNDDIRKYIVKKVIVEFV
ncbi:hypothetical protein DRJ25_04430 [Candidatus Woesearchaeota archaeon]|nr:MAG: hypothetical protein DRJ25_04430 [Candidatus Woesearchaeota archaeon]